MRKTLYLFLVLFNYIVSAQSTAEETIISNKLRDLTKPNIDRKYKEASLLQLKAESEKLGYDLGILISGDYLMLLYGESNRHQEGLALGEQLKKVAKGKKDTHGYIADIYRMNALALGYLGLNDACLKDLKKALNYAKDIKDRNTRVYQLSTCYLNMGLHYNLKRFEDKSLRDSLLYTYEKSLELAKQINDNSKAIRKDVKYDQIAFTEMRLGIFYLEQNNIKGSLELAEKYLIDGLKIYQDKKYNLSPFNKIMILNQVSWLYMEKKEYVKSIEYAIEALELEKRYREPYHRVESFEFLADCYSEINEKKKSKFYMNEYTYLKDSLADVDRTHANITMKKLVTKLDSEQKQSSNKQWLITGIIALIAGGCTLIAWKRRSKALLRKYEQMIKKLREEPTEQKKQSIITKKGEISNETEERIIKQLDTFEDSEEFLRKDLTIGLLSSQLNTNSKYLSEIIKNKKSHNFSSYINYLKINYIVHKLYNEPKYRDYKISYLAEICGYSSPQAFFVAFKKINEVTPAYFIQKLNEDVMI
ncbi:MULTISPECIES: helix-turn-helix domain-containing protein [unclassified Chryseobacterium]|uniref:helix-turn-helix domain-containing protein n=1 Tax=unclassified Chryseobacterium TaxID=2593645 RepID=UPI00301042D6